MNANAVFDAAAALELGNLQGGPVCISCHERSSLRIVVELLYKNELLRFKLSESQALVGELRLALEQVHLGSATELQGAVNVLSALKPELAC